MPLVKKQLLAEYNPNEMKMKKIITIFHRMNELDSRKANGWIANRDFLSKSINHSFNLGTLLWNDKNF